MLGVEVYQPPRKKEKEKVSVNYPTRMYLVTVLIPRMMIDAIDDLVSDEVFASRAEAIRASILLMLIELGKIKNDSEFIKLLVRRTPEHNKKSRKSRKQHMRE